MDNTQSIHGDSLDELEKLRRARAMAARAMHLRKRLGKGKSITEDQREWLERYEREHPSRRPVRSAPPMPQPPQLPGIEINIEGVESNESKDPSDIPIGNAASEPSNPKTEENRSNQSTPNEPSGKQATDEETRKAAVGLAGMYGEWLKLASRQCAEMGGYGIPNQLIDQIVVPATQRVAEKYLPAMGSPMADEIIVAGSGLGMVVQRTMLRRRHAENKNVVDVKETPIREDRQHAKPPNQGEIPRLPFRKPNPLDIPISGGD